MQIKLKSTTVYFLGGWVFGLAAGICFKEGGTDAAHRLEDFILGNALGITSTWFVIRIYARMNVNLALLIRTGGAFIIFQTALWQIYDARLTLVQWAGILTVLIGMVLSLWPRRTKESECPEQGISPAPPPKVTA